MNVKHMTQQYERTWNAKLFILRYEIDRPESIHVNIFDHVHTARRQRALEQVIERNQDVATRVAAVVHDHVEVPLRSVHPPV